jgi:hypothetical protein
LLYAGAVGEVRDLETKTNSHGVYRSDLPRKLNKL